MGNQAQTVFIGFSSFPPMVVSEDIQMAPTESTCYKMTQLFFSFSFSLSFSRGSFRLRSLFPDCLPLDGEACAGWLCFKENKQEEIITIFLRRLSRVT